MATTGFRRLGRHSALLALPLLLAACDSGGGDTPSVGGVIVANQGNFSTGTGSISTFDPATGNGTPAAVTGLGTILQSVLVHEGRLYASANTAGRIDVFDAETLARQPSISGTAAAPMPSPRYMAAANGRLYVTNLYRDAATFSGGTVTVVDLATSAAVASVVVGGNPEGIAVVGGRVVVANSGFGAGTTLSVIDPATNAVTQTVDVGCAGPRALVPEGNDLWVVCTGRVLYDAAFNATGEVKGEVVVLDARTFAVRARMPAPTRLGAAGPGRDAALGARSLYVAAGRTLRRYDLAANRADSTVALPAGGDPIGAVAVDAAAGRLYLGRVPGFDRAGLVTVHTDAGAETARFTAGIAPTDIALRFAR